MIFLRGFRNVACVRYLHSPEMRLARLGWDAWKGELAGHGYFSTGRVSSNPSCCGPSRTTRPTFSQSRIAMRSAMLLPGPSWFISQPMQCVSWLSGCSWQAITRSGACPRAAARLPVPSAIVPARARCRSSEYPCLISRGFVPAFQGHFAHCFVRLSFQVEVIAATGSYGNERGKVRAQALGRLFRGVPRIV